MTDDSPLRPEPIDLVGQELRTHLDEFLALGRPEVLKDGVAGVGRVARADKARTPSSSTAGFEYR